MLDTDRGIRRRSLRMICLSETIEGLHEAGAGHLMNRVIFFVVIYFFESNFAVFFWGQGKSCTMVRNCFCPCCLLKVMECSMKSDKVVGSVGVRSRSISVRCICVCPLCYRSEVAGASCSIHDHWIRNKVRDCVRDYIVCSRLIFQRSRG